MDISRLGPIDRIAYSLAEPHRTGVGIHQFWMPQIDFVPWTSGDARPSEPWVVDRVAAEPSRADDLGGPDDPRRRQHRRGDLAPAG